jgi:hypothetical protein
MPQNMPRGEDTVFQPAENAILGMMPGAYDQGKPVPATPQGYVHGDDAMPQADVDKLTDHVDPSGKMTNGERNLFVIQAAADRGDMPAAWAVAQNQRVNWNAKMGFAQVALDGTSQKPGDLAAAAKAATQAYPHMLDGSEAEFKPAQGGVVATVTPPGGKTPVKIPLTADQFRQWTDISDINGGQYDSVMENGGALNVLKKITQGLGKPPSQGQPGQMVNSMDGQQGQPQGTQGQQAPAQGAPPATPQQPPDAFAYPKGSAGDLAQQGYDPQDLRRAHLLFPSDLAKQMDYLEKQKQQSITNDISKTRANQFQQRGDTAVKLEGMKEGNSQTLQDKKGTVSQANAGTRQAGVIYQADQRSMTALAGLAQKAQAQGANEQDKAIGQAASMARSQIAAGLPVSPEYQTMLDTIGAKRQQNLPTGATPTSVQPAAPAAGAQPAAQQAAPARTAAGGKSQVRYDKAGRAWVMGPNGTPVPAPQ